MTSRRNRSYMAASCAGPDSSSTKNSAVGSSLLYVSPSRSRIFTQCESAGSKIGLSLEAAAACASVRE